jgi:hypothetical protein
VVKKYQSKLTISYYYKDNSGPGDSRNYGMKARRLFYLYWFRLFHRNIFQEVDNIKESYVDCFGGPDRALDSFSDIQRRSTLLWLLSDYRRVRGGSEKIGKFQPRSFNMDCPGKRSTPLKALEIHPEDRTYLFDYGI